MLDDESADWGLASASSPRGIDVLTTLDSERALELLTHDRQMCRQLISGIYFPSTVRSLNKTEADADANAKINLADTELSTTALHSATNRPDVSESRVGCLGNRRSWPVTAGQSRI